MACGILVRPGMEPVAPVLGAQVMLTGPPGKSASDASSRHRSPACSHSGCEFPPGPRRRQVTVDGPSQAKGGKDSYSMTAREIHSSRLGVNEGYP